MSRSLNVIGAGRLGQTLAYLFAKTKQVCLQSVCTRSLKTAQQAVEFIGSGTACTTIHELLPADLTLIASPDALLEPLCHQLSHSGTFIAGNIVFHCSGVLSSDILQPLKKKGVFVASIHPMQSFASPEKSVQHYAGTYCAMEGDEEALKILEPLFSDIGSQCYLLDKTKKALYHAAGIFASNYLVTLAAEALACLREAGVEKTMGLKIITQLMQGTLHHLENVTTPEKALTGPIQRADLESIQKHLETLSDPIQRQLYVALARATLPLTRHDADLQARLRALLDRKYSP